MDGMGNEIIVSPATMNNLLTLCGRSETSMRRQNLRFVTSNLPKQAAVHREASELQMHLGLSDALKLEEDAVQEIYFN